MKTASNNVYNIGEKALKSKLLARVKLCAYLKVSSFEIAPARRYLQIGHQRPKELEFLSKLNVFKIFPNAL